MAMDVKEIKQRLGKPATKLTAGGFRPTNADDESWLGRVFSFRPDEVVPRNDKGKELLPFAQFYLPRFPFYSALLKDVSVLTVFISASFPEQFEKMGNNWMIREYHHHDTVVRKELSVAGSYLKPFPVKAELISEDYPLWDGGGIPEDIELEILALKKNGKIGNYYDITTHVYEHKMGGYPSFCQSGVNPGDDFEFIFQISSDSKINLNVVDSGSLMFWKSKKTGEWAMYYDFH